MSVIFPGLPAALVQAINRPIALTTRSQAQQLLSQNRPLSPIDHATVINSNQDYLDGIQNSLLDVLNYLQQISGTTIPVPTPTPSGVTTQSQTLTTASTTITASLMPAPANALLVVELVQDATGGRNATGAGSDFINFPSTINRNANGVTEIIFKGSGGKWRMAATGVFI